jgi:uncharacterized protein (TIGR02145 family)
LFAVNAQRGLAPKGYHIPSVAEWTILTDFLGGVGAAGEKLKSKYGWAKGGNGDNSSGFNGLPGGNCSSFGNFYSITGYGNFWSSSENLTNYIWDRDLDYSSTRVYRSNGYKNIGLSVRCLRD